MRIYYEGDNLSRKNRNKSRIQNQPRTVLGPGAIQTEKPFEPGPPVVIPTFTDAQKAFLDEKMKNSKLMNGFCDAFGFTGGGIGGGINPFGFSGNGLGSAPTISDASTAFENLRWYLVSNFRQLLSQVFVEIGLVRTICVVPVMDGLRGGVMFKSKQLSEEELQELKVKMDRENDINTAGWGTVWTRLYGGGGILILTDDQDPQDPIDITKIAKGADIGFRAVDMWELYWDKQNVEGYDAEIQAEDFEYYNYYSEPVHKTRVMRLKGAEAPSFIRPRLRGWGLSEVEALIRSMNQYLKATDLGFEVLDEFKLDVYKIKNLISTLLGPNGTQAVQQRVALANWQKNYQNAVVMDAEDDFDHKQLSFAGLAEAMAGIRQQVASDMRIPAIKLFGQSFSTGGMGTSSVEEMENYNSMIESEVRNKLKWHILKMAEIRCMQLFGYIPDDLELEFKPLRELTAEQQETVKEKKFNRIAAAKASGDLTTQEYRDACNKGELFDIKLDTKATGLNPNDPELEEVASGERSKEIAVGPGDDEAEAGGDPNKEDGANKEYTQKVAPRLQAVRNYMGETIRPHGFIARFRNSPEFDKASYEADGGDSWIADGRKELFENPGGVDEGLWAKAKDASQKAFGEVRWKFVTWWYKKQGGKFT